MARWINTRSAKGPRPKSTTAMVAALCVPAAAATLFALDQPRGPTDADQKSVRSGNTNFVDAPFAVAKNPAGTDDQVVDASGDLGNLRRADEDTEGVLSDGTRQGPFPA